MKRLAVLASVLLLDACGYSAVHGGATAGPEERFAVVLASSNMPDIVASDEVVAGVREELARNNALASGDAYPRCEVEVLRADESADGIGATRNPDGVRLPDARATRIGVVARAWIVRAKDGPRERDTGDVRTEGTVAVAPNARAATFQHMDALRAASRRVGTRMGARLLGLPAATE